MKAEINTSIKLLKVVNEINIFRAMEKSLAKKTSAVFVKETHGRSGLVEYTSNNCPVPVVKEISDLLIVSFNPNNSITRICFLQAKYHRNYITPFLKFKGDFYQWELLRLRPTIKNFGNSYFPSDILSFTNFKSITAFGVFYYDFNNDIDMLFSIPELIKPTKIKKHKSNPSTTLIFQGKKNCPLINCWTSTTNELMTTCNLDVFETQLLKGVVGAPINGYKSIESYLHMAIKSIQKDYSHDLLNQIDRSFGPIETHESGVLIIPNMLFIKSNGINTYE